MALKYFLVTACLIIFLSLSATPVAAQFACKGCFAGVSAGSSTIADVNGDDIQDVLITGSESAILYLGDGDGGFSKAGANLTGVTNSSSSIADVNGDGHPDLLITGYDADRTATATLYLGDDNGGFYEAEADLTGVTSGSTSIADVNGDGHQDLLITGRDSDTNYTAKLYLGDGKGGFSAAGANLTEVYFSSSSIADVNGDGHLDLLITGQGRKMVGTGAAERQRTGVMAKSQIGLTAKVYLGNGDGGFSEGEAGLTGVGNGSTSIADVNADGYPDLLITGEDADGNPSSTLYLGDGDGGFYESGTDFFSTYLPSYLLNVFGYSASRKVDLTGVKESSSSIADVNADGYPDLFITGEDSSENHTATLYLGEGNGGFTKAGDNLSGVVNGSISIADMNKDSQLDVFITGSKTATLYFGESNGAFSQAGSGLDGAWLSSTSVGDVNEDGHPDVLITGSETTTVYLGGDDGFSEAEVDLIGVEDGSTSIGDVNGDGHLDLLITGEDADWNKTATLYLGDGDGGFSTADADLTGVGVSSSSIADLNGDDHPDLLIAGVDANDNPTTTLYLGNGNGDFSRAEAGLIGVKDGAISVADVDDDGHLDLLVSGWDGDSQAAKLYMGDGNGHFTDAEADLTAVVYSSSSIADVDGDGHLDLLIAGEDAERNPTTTLYLGNGNGRFSVADAGLTGVQLSSSAIADVNDDGHLDLLIAGTDNDDNSSTTLYLGDGNANFTATEAGLRNLTDSILIADLNGNSRLDILLTGQTETNTEVAWIFYNNQPTDNSR